MTPLHELISSVQTCRRDVMSPMAGTSLRLFILSCAAQQGLATSARADKVPNLL